MLTDSELRTLISDIESDRIERTVSVNNKDKFAEAICAFANDLPNHRRPGYLMIGVNNSGEVTGIEVSDELLLNLSALRSDGNIQPLPAMTVEKRSLPGGNIAVVEVQPSDLPPVRYRGRIYVRVGPRKAIATEQEERILAERRAMYARTFDARPVREATLGDMSLALFAAYRQQVVSSDIIAENHRTTEEQLASLRFYDLRAASPTAAGILLFGSNPRYFLSGAYIQFLRIKGTTLTDELLDQAEISGDLLSVLRELDGRVKAGIMTSLVPVSALREKQVPDYPEIAIRELLVNGLMHRDYESNTPVRFYWFDDRIEIHNPGGLYGEVTLETLMRRSSYRNPIVAEAMKTLGYVNRFGYGIQRAQKALTELGKPAAEFEADQQTFAVIIRRS